jgi:non-hemolytic enterotoxin B/C
LATTFKALLQQHNIKKLKKNIMTTTNMTASSKQAFTSSANQISQGLIIQQYCNTVIAQPTVDFSSDANLAELQKDINNALATAVSHANKYLNTISPRLLSSISNLDNYFSLTLSVPTSCPQGSTIQTWIATLNAMKLVAENNKRDINVILTDLQNISIDFKNDSATFDSLATQINNKVTGDNGELDKLKEGLSNINTQIAGTSVAIAFGALTIVASVFTIAVGAVAGFVTAGTSAELVIGGVAALAGGVGAEIGASITLKGLLDQKASILTEQAQLNSEVILITGFNTALDNLSQQANNAYEAAKAMENAWDLLANDMESYIDDLKMGTIAPDTLRESFLNEANSDIVIIRQDISTIKAQMAGVTIQQTPRGETLNNFAKTINLN